MNWRVCCDKLRDQLHKCFIIYDIFSKDTIIKILIFNCHVNCVKVINLYQPLDLVEKGVESVFIYIGIVLVKLETILENMCLIIFFSYKLYGCIRKN